MYTLFVVTRSLTFNFPLTEHSIHFSCSKCYLTTIHPSISLSSYSHNHDLTTTHPSMSLSSYRHNHALTTTHPNTAISPNA